MPADDVRGAGHHPAGDDPGFQHPSGTEAIAARSDPSPRRPARTRWRLDLPAIRLASGLLPLRPRRVPADLLAGVTLAALAIPEVLGYAKIARTPVITGLYTILLPMAAFALFGSSRHLVVGADSATAAITAAGLAPLAAAGSLRYLALASAAALLAGALLIVARIARLGFLADFLSRTVLIGFLTGVGIQVAAGQIGEMLGLPAGGHGTVGRLVHDAENVGMLSATTALISVIVIVIVLGTRALAPRVPGALLTVVGAVVVGRAAGLSRHGVALLGPVPSGLPHLGVPHVQRGDLSTLLATSASLFVVIVAQSAATSRAYAARYDEELSENTDLVGLAVANVSAAFSGTFVVNGSPTKTEIVDGAGGRSQLAQLATCAIVLIVLVMFTRPLRYLPSAVLAAIVFLIGIELIDLRGLRRVWEVRRDEFVVALITAAAVVFVGVEQGILLAMAVSVVDHLRYSYHPRNTVLVAEQSSRWRTVPVKPGARTVPGLVVYRFGTSLYYANARRLLEDARDLLEGTDSLRWFALDAGAIADVDFSAAATLRGLVQELARRGVRLVLTEVAPYLLAELDRYRLTAEMGSGALYPTPADVLNAWHETQRAAASDETSP